MCIFFCWEMKVLFFNFVIMSFVFVLLKVSVKIKYNEGSIVDWQPNIVAESKSDKAFFP